MQKSNLPKDMCDMIGSPSAQSTDVLCEQACRLAYMQKIMYIFLKIYSIQLTLFLSSLKPEKKKTFLP